MARFVLTHDFVPSGEGQIAASAGETVTLVERNEGGWATVIKDNGDKGFVAMSFLTEAGKKPLPPAPSPPPAAPYQPAAPGAQPAINVQVNQVSNQTVNNGRGGYVNHCCHCVTCALTGGLWIPCWVLACVGICDACAGCRC